MCGAVCGAVGACRAGRIVAAIRHSPREDYPRCSVGWCAMQAGPELGGMGRRYVSSVQFSSVQFSSVQFSSVQSTHAAVVPLACADAIACTHACMHWLTAGSQYRMAHDRTPARIARHSRRLSQPLCPRWKALSSASLTLSTKRRSSCCCSLTIENKSSMAILLPHSCCKRHRQPEWTAAKRCSSGIRRVELRREAAAGIQQQPPASSSTKAMCHVEACAHHARRWPMCDGTVALAPGAAVHRASSTPSHENRRSELCPGRVRKRRTRATLRANVIHAVFMGLVR